MWAPVLQRKTALTAVHELVQRTSLCRRAAARSGTDSRTDRTRRDASRAVRDVAAAVWPEDVQGILDTAAAAERRGGTSGRTDVHGIDVVHAPASDPAATWAVHEQWLRSLGRLFVDAGTLGTAAERRLRQRAYLGAVCELVDPHSGKHLSHTALAETYGWTGLGRDRLDGVRQDGPFHVPDAGGGQLLSKDAVQRIEAAWRVRGEPRAQTSRGTEENHHLQRSDKREERNAVAPQGRKHCSGARPRRHTRTICENERTEHMQ